MQLDDRRDSIKWSLSKLDLSMYNFVNQLALPLNKSIWKLKIPLKIKVFIWFLLKEVTLTKENLLRRRWKGDDRCCFCDKKKPSNISFFIVMLRDLSGEFLLWHLDCNLL